MTEPRLRSGLVLGDTGLDIRFARERRHTAAANARADRERARAQMAEERLAKAEQRIADLEERLATIEASIAWKLTLPARRLANAVPKPLYRLLRGIPAQSPERPASAANPGIAVPQTWRLVHPDHVAPGSPRALLIDNNWPRSDRDAGSIEIVNLAEALLALGFEVLFATDLSWATDPEGHEALAARGVRCMGFADTPSLHTFLQQNGTSFALVVLNRVFCGGRHMEAVRTYCTAARVVFNTIDLAHLRIAREAAVSGSEAILAVAAVTREREEWLATEADATFVVSEAERATLRAAVPGADVFVLPLARTVKHPHTPFPQRHGIGFIGGFTHSPNADAVDFFLREVWPLVLKGNPACKFSIVGADLPSSILEEAPRNVEYLGSIPEVGPWFESLRLTVAPLRFGAGVKGKVVSSLAAGVPCVATTVAVEGMGLRDGVDILVADTPDQMAEQMSRLYDDNDLWGRLSIAGLAHIANHFSPEAWRATLADALRATHVLFPAVK